MVRARPAAALCAAIVLVVAVFAPASASAQTSNDLTIRQVDGTNPDAVVVDFLFAGDRGALGDLTLRENGSIVETSPVALVAESDQQIGTVLVVDTSTSMADDGKFTAAKAAAIDFIGGFRAADRVAIVSFSTTAEVVQEFTDDQDVLLAAIEGLEANGGTALFDGIQLGVDQFAGTDLQPNLVVLSDGDDRNSSAAPGAVRASVSEAGAFIVAVALGDGAAEIPGFSEIAEASGGRVVRAATADDLAAVYENIQNRLQNQYRITFASTTDGEGLASLTMSASGERVTVDYSPGSRSTGSQLIVTDSGQPPGPSFLRTTGGLYLIALMVLVATGTAVFSVVTSFVGDRRNLDSVLQPYADGFVAASDDSDTNQLASSPLLQRAVELTGGFADRRGVLDRVEASLERANLPLRAAEAIFFYLATVVVIFLLGTVITQNLIFGVVVAAIAGMAGPATLNFLATRRKKQFQAMLPDMLQLLSGTLRAGYSLMQGVEAVSQEVSEPMGREMRRVVTEAQLGRPLEESLDGVAERMDSPDFAWAVMAIRIQREVGGNLSELLLTVAETMVARERLRRDVSSLTAEGKISAIVLGILPIGIGGAMYVINQEYIETLFQETSGQIALGGAVLLMLVGFYWMKKTVEIDI